MFFLTILDASQNSGPRSQPRCVGYFNTLAEVTTVLKQNSGGLDEDGYFNLAVIEEFLPGLYATSIPRKFWYAYLPSKNSWEPCSAPIAYQQINKFALTS